METVRKYIDLTGLKHYHDSLTRILDNKATKGESYTKAEADADFLKTATDLGGKTPVSFYLTTSGSPIYPYTNTDSIYYTDGKTLTETLSGIDDLNTALEAILHGSNS